MMCVPSEWSRADIDTARTTALAFARPRRPREAEDVAQDVALRIIQTPRSEVRNVEALACRIAANVIAERARTAKRRQDLDTTHNVAAPAEFDDDGERVGVHAPSQEFDTDLASIIRDDTPSEEAESALRRFKDLIEDGAELQTAVRLAAVKILQTMIGRPLTINDLDYFAHMADDNPADPRPAGRRTYLCEMSLEPGAMVRASYVPTDLEVAAISILCGIPQLECPPGGTTVDAVLRSERDSIKKARGHASMVPDAVEAIRNRLRR